jgi:hypothetical protein
MTSKIPRLELKKNGLTRLSNSNKNIFIRRVFPNKNEIIKTQSGFPDKIPIKNNGLSSNTSVKKLNSIQRISIIDYENKNLNSKNNNKELIKKNTSMKINKKFDASNKENQIINQKDKIEHKRTQKKIIRKMGNETKLLIKQNLSIMKNKIKKQVLNKYNRISIMLNAPEKGKNLFKENIKTISQINNNNDLNKKSLKKESLISQSKTMCIENGKTMDEEEDGELEENKVINISNDDEDIEYTLKYDKNNKSDKKNKIKSRINNGKFEPNFNSKKEKIICELKKQVNNPDINIMLRKKNNGVNLATNNNFKINNSINNEIRKENCQQNYINIINNFDIINIINRKEQNKKLNKSNQSNSKLYKTEDISKEDTIKLNPALEKKFKINGLNIVYNDSNKNSQKTISEKNQNKEAFNVPKTVRNINHKIKRIYLSKQYNINQTISIGEIDTSNNNIRKKWDNKNFIPVVNASLVKKDEIRKNRITFFKKILIDNNNQNKTIVENNSSKNTLKHINFGDNNKKKREMLFSLSDKKIKNENINILSFHFKRNQHITERNRSLKNIINNISNDNNISNNYNSNIDSDLNIQEKKLNLISSEINKFKTKQKFSIPNKYSFSLDKIIDKNINNNNTEETKDFDFMQRYQKKKKYKTFHIKFDSLNLVKYKNDSFINGHGIVMKRGDLLNNLRKIKYNYTNLDESKIN